MFRRSRTASPHRIVPALAAVCVLLAGCQSTAGSPSPSGSGPGETVAGASTTSSPAEDGGSTEAGPGDPGSPTLLSIAPASAETTVRPDRPVTVSLVNGELTAVTLVTADGTELEGEVDGTGTWRNTDPLAAGASYTVRASARGTDGTLVTDTSTFSTASASRLVSTTLIPGDDWEVGVGMPVVVVFSRPVTNRRAAEAAMSVTSTPAVTGGWRWFSDTEAHWRPEEYWPAGARVTVRAATSGTELADGAWGRRTVTTSFTIARRQIMTVDIAGHTLTVKREGSVVRTLPVTTGKPRFATRNGIKVVMDRESLVRMNSETTGIDASDPEAYDLQVKWAMRLTWSGEYLHAAPWSVGSQGRANVSHGCTGLSTANARWLYDNTKIGDVVVFTNGSRELEWGNGYTDWNMPFEEYVGAG